jgi:hypothetical protein
MAQKSISLFELYSSPCLISYQCKEDEIGGACSVNGGKRNVYKLLVGKPEGKETSRQTKMQVGG